METLLVIVGLLAIGATVNSSDNIKNNTVQSPICRASKQCIIDNSTDATLPKDSMMRYILEHDITEGR